MGLTESEALARLAAEGSNDLPRHGRRTFVRIVGDVLREPMFALLLGAGAVYFVLGDLTEGLVLLGFAMISVSITIVQETRSERVLEALRDMTAPRAMVVRDRPIARLAGPRRLAACMSLLKAHRGLLERAGRLDPPQMGANRSL